MSTEFNSEQIAAFLRANPEFFDAHADVLLSLNVTHPHGGRTVSIPERQLIATREKAKFLEGKLAELIGFAQENDALAEKTHRLTLALIDAPSLEQLIDIFYLDLLDNFQVPHVAVRFWNVNAPEAPGPEFQTASDELIQFVSAMTAPYCGNHPVFESNLWFGEHAPHLKSYAMVALKAGDSFGLLLMASENAQRFYAEMGTVFLTRIGEVFAHAVARYLSRIPAKQSA